MLLFFFLKEQIGILRGGVLILLQAKRLEFAKIIPCRPSHEHHIGDQTVKCVQVLQQEELVKLQKVVTYFPLIHDCIGGKCRKKELSVEKKIEQQCLQVTETVLSHNYDHRLYFVNPYSLPRKRV